MQETKSQLLAIWTSGIPKQLIERTEKIVKVCVNLGCIMPCADLPYSTVVMIVQS